MPTCNCNSASNIFLRCQVVESGGVSMLSLLGIVCAVNMGRRVDQQ